LFLEGQIKAAAMSGTLAERKNDFKKKNITAESGGVIGDRPSDEMKRAGNCTKEERNGAKTLQREIDKKKPKPEQIPLKEWPVASWRLPLSRIESAQTAPAL
jgi:hypothetical protein